MKSMGFDGIIAKLEDFIQQHSVLLDENNQRKILEFFGSDFNEIKKLRFKEVLGVISID